MVEYSYMASFNIENYLDEIVQEVEKVRQESGDISVNKEDHKEIVRRVVGERLGKMQQQPTQQPVFNVIQDDGTEKSYDNPDLKPTVDNLVSTVFEKNLDAAVDEVKSYDNPALLDAFHDALVDRLYDQLIQTGKLKQT